jgi:hypothetical protein
MAHDERQVEQAAAGGLVRILPFPAPILTIDDFLPSNEAQLILSACIDLEADFAPAEVFDSERGACVDLGYRRNRVMYVEDGDRDPQRLLIRTFLTRRIGSPEYRVLWSRDCNLFELVNRATWYGMTVSRYGDGNYYRPHSDIDFTRPSERLVSLAYYVNREPARFYGGALRFSFNGAHVSVEPRHNRAVVFPSALPHEVGAVRLQSDAWGDGRFSINCWIGFR